MKFLYHILFGLLLFGFVQAQTKTIPLNSGLKAKGLPEDAIRIFDHGCDTFLIPKVIPVSVSTASSVPKETVRSGVMDRDGRLWFGTWDGIYVYDSKIPAGAANSFTVFRVSQDGPPPNHSVLSRIYSMVMDRNGKLWFGTPTGPCCYDGNKFISYALPEAAHAIDYYPTGVNWDLNQLSARCVVGIYMDRRGDLWFGTWGGGAYRYDGNTFTNISQKDGLCQNVVQAFFENAEGQFFFGTRGNGLCFYDGKSYKEVKVKHEPSDGHYFQILEDRAGRLWFSTRREGIYRLETRMNAPGPMEFSNFLGTNAVAGITEDRKGRIWFGSDGSGAFAFENKNFTNYTIKEGLCHNSVWVILEDLSGNLWFGTREGLCKYDGESFQNLTK